MTLHSRNNPDHRIPCPLCKTTSSSYFTNAFFRCPSCDGIFRNPELILSPEAEKNRYTLHNNDPDDPGYRKFVSPLVSAIVDHIPPGSHGLDFGAGPGPVVSAVLREKGFHTDLYDPFFHPDAQLLKRTYDFVFCCEVIEHFCKPANEFPRLLSLIRPGGSLFCMTHIHTDDIPFPTWYYKNDETHVFFYRVKTFHTLSHMFGFTSCSIDGRVVRLDAPKSARIFPRPELPAANTSVRTGTEAPSNTSDTPGDRFPASVTPVPVVTASTVSGEEDPDARS